MNKGLIRSAAFLAGLSATAAGPVYAQEEDEPSSFRQRLRVEQNFGIGDNVGLENPSEGRTSLATTRLSYGLETETDIQSLSFAIGAGLRFGNIAEGNNMKTGFVDPLVALRYNREGANALFSFEADYRETDISQRQPLWAFLDQDGNVAPPADFSSIRGSGERRSYSAGLQFETGLQDPFGLRFSASTNTVDYIDTTDASLTDYESNRVDLTTLFRFDKITTGTLYFGYNTYSNDDQTQTDRKTKIFQAGFERQLSSISSLSFSAGHSTVETTETNPVTGARVTSTSGGPSGTIDFQSDMPNGTFGANLNVSQNEDGQRGTFRVSRSIGLPRGSLSANIGLTQFEDTDARVVGGLNWRHQLPTSTITMQYNRGVYIDNNDEDRFTDYVVAGYSHEINQISSISANLSLSYTEASSTEDATKRGNLVISYNHELTPDWSFNTGVAFRTLQDDSTGEADSTSVFFGIGRNFDLSH